MLLELISVVLGSGERQTRRDDSFDSRVICQVQEERNAVQAPVLFKVLLEEARGFHVHTHSGEYDREVVLVAVEDVLGWPFHKASLSDNLGGNLNANRTYQSGQAVKCDGEQMTSLCGRPAAEKIGIFCPRAIEFITSIVEIPVWIISSGYIREYGLMGEPFRRVVIAHIARM